ncbi:flagellar hook-associated protein 3 FlgL [Enterobacter sp. BIGb0383]|uniref:flagellar hook-associated protein FlgL n=1 Tax=unclassified Enterobacter TaxID=2608935 RepID=UPI000F492D7E|nr:MULTISPECIES: flagellar hook-associated protein FlgL [unclassified Enterobacter]ROP49391.1 flagellar hook-associated protein 3 FlgL [Enterobacter sp. BIGb0383]ROS00733.1 flagellar hook-associated protein 3 FlgL [Enterobacter sp. BIGb0359]
MRISTQMMYDQNMRSVTSSQAEWLKSGEQMSTGKRVVNASDDPVAAAQAVVLSQAQAQNSQYATARGFAYQRVALEDSVLGNVATVISSAQSTLIQANTGVLADSDRASLATQLQGIRDQLMNLANTSDGNGRYIFGGFKTEDPSFDPATGVYQGGTNAVTQQVDAARSMVIGHTGKQIFDSITSNATQEANPADTETSLFVMLDTAIAALKTPTDGDATAQAAQTARIEKSQRGLKNSLDNVVTVRAEVGVQMQELTALNELGEDRELGQKEQMSNLVDVDTTAAISSYIMNQAALQASYKAFSDLQGMSLFQLNR